MPLTIAPAALPVPKKGAFYQVFLIVAGTSPATPPVPPVTWAVTSGALPAFLSLVKVADTIPSSGVGGAVAGAVAVVQGRVPNTLDGGNWTCTITATDSTPTTPLTGTVVSTTITNVVDGPDRQAYHGTEANRTTVTLLDTIDHGPGLAVADYLARMWPLTGPSQNS